MSNYRKDRTINVLKRSVEDCLDKATNEGLFDAVWEIPKNIVEKRKYFQLQPIFEYYKNQKYVVEFVQDEEECRYVYFEWF